VLAAGECASDGPQAGQVVHVVGLGWYLGYRDKRMSSGEMLGQPPLRGG